MRFLVLRLLGLVLFVAFFGAAASSRGRTSAVPPDDRIRGPTMLVRVAISPEDRAACLAIRRTVFVEEQRVPEEEELDAHEDEATHFVAVDDGSESVRAVGTARLWVSPEGLAKAQRVAVLADVRGRGFGVALMAALEAEARRRGHETLHLSAQVNALPFYERLGFEAFGEHFWDAGILHRKMQKPLR